MGRTLGLLLLLFSWCFLRKLNPTSCWLPSLTKRKMTASAGSAGIKTWSPLNKTGEQETSRYAAAFVSLPPLLFSCLDREGVGHTDSTGEPRSTDIYSNAASHLALTQLEVWSNSWQDLLKVSGYIKTKIYSMGESCCCCRKLQSTSKHTHTTKSTVKYPGDATGFTWQPLGGECWKW